MEDLQCEKVDLVVSMLRDGGSFSLPALEALEAAGSWGMQGPPPICPITVSGQRMSLPQGVDRA